MNLPNAAAVEIAQEKLTDYLLNPLHPDGAGKALFFLAQGFRPDAWQLFADALRQLAAQFPVAKQVDSPHGTKFVVEGQLETPGGKSPFVRTVWIVDRGGDHPRLVYRLPTSTRRMTVLKEHERVVLLGPIHADGLEAGDVGTIVHVYRDGQAYEVEFVALNGHTRAVATVAASQVRPVTRHDMTHTREIQTVG